MKIERIPIDAVEVGAGHRPADASVVASIAASMELLGQLQPITVYEESGAAHLVAGRHRLEAARSLSWDEIEAVFVTGDEIDRRLREISENLHRNELTVQERSEQITEWVELVGRRAVVSAQLGQKLGRPESGDSKAARDLNLTRQQIQRAKAIASTTPEAKAAAKAAGIDDNQKKLLAVAKEPTPERQVAKVLQFKEPGPISLKTWRDDFERIWARGTEDDHNWAREFIDAPIMDSRFR